MNKLDSVRIVLLRPTHPGNIGAAARAMKTMGLTRLDVVAPDCGVECGPDCREDARAIAMAAGAQDVLAGARIHSDIASAIGDCALVVGTSGRRRGIAWPILTPDEAAQALIREAARAPVALLFGQERTGLSNEELDLCGFHVAIPANEYYPSLNLAGAVQVMAYEIRRAWLGEAGVADHQPGQPESAEPLATHAQVERFYEHIERVMTRLDFLKSEHPRKLMRRLRRLFGRVALDSNEVNILRGILTAVEEATPARPDRNGPDSQDHVQKDS